MPRRVTANRYSITEVGDAANVKPADALLVVSIQQACGIPARKSGNQSGLYDALMAMGVAGKRRQPFADSVVDLHCALILEKPVHGESAEVVRDAESAAAGPVWRGNSASTRRANAVIGTGWPAGIKFRP